MRTRLDVSHRESNTLTPNLATELKGFLRKVPRPGTKDHFYFYGFNFPTQLTKRFVSTFTSKQTVKVEVVDHELRFFWGERNFAHINSVERAAKIQNEIMAIQETETFTVRKRA